jgi:hypothetical protein
MPICCADLPHIRNCVRDLLRLLEDLPRSLRALATAKERGLLDPTHVSQRGYVVGTPRDDLEAAREKLLAALMPSGVLLSRGGDSDITNSELDDKQVVILQDIWMLCLPQRWHDTCGDRRSKAIIDLKNWLPKLDSAPHTNNEIEEQQGENVIHLLGKQWEIGYGNEHGRFPERGNKCLQWLCKILSRPNQSLTVAEVLGDPQGTLAGDARLRGDRETNTVGMRQIKKRLAEIEDIRAETGGSATLDAEQADLLCHLEQADTHLQTPLRKAHHNISTQIRTFVKKVRGCKMPHLAAHLKDALRLDLPYFGYYPPADSPGWKI